MKLRVLQEGLLDTIIAVLVNIETMSVNIESDGGEQLYTDSCT